MIRTILTVVALIWSQIFIIVGIMAHIERLQQVGFLIMVPALWMGVVLIIRWHDRKHRRGKITIIKRANFSHV